MHCTLDVFFPKHVTTLSCRNHLFLLFIFFELGGTLSLECREDHSWERGWVGLLESLETCWSGFKFQLRHFPAVWLQTSCPWPSAFSPVMGMLTPNSSGCCEAWVSPWAHEKHRTNVFAWSLFILPEFPSFLSYCSEDTVAYPGKVFLSDWSPWNTLGLPQLEINF